MINSITNRYIPSSFRDPGDFLFYKEKSIYRQINNLYKHNYDHLINSGLYKTLLDKQLLIPHDEVDTQSPEPDKAYKILKPEIIPFISYPYEWCFSQLKNAALTTFKIQKIALDFGMTLKDCSAYNIQFRKGKPIFIDTLSFEKYVEGQTWIAYKQACQHFIAPLALIHHLAISNNLPMSKIANFFKGICKSLIVEFIPKDDSQVQKLLSTREDIFTDYTRQGFENEFGRYFVIISSEKIIDSKRILYLMQKKEN